MHRQLVAVLDGSANFIDFREVKTWRNTLCVQVERNVHQINISGSFTIAEQAAFNAVSARHQSQLAGSRPCTTVIVRMHRKHDGIAPREVAMHPLHHVGKDIWR